MKQKRGDLAFQVDELANHHKDLSGDPEQILPEGDYLRRVEQALERFGYEECLCAVDGYHRWVKQTNSPHKHFWHAFPPLQRNNQKVTNRLDEGRFKAFVTEGQKNKSPPKPPKLERPRADKESEAENKRLDNFWAMHHRKALAEAKKQNKNPEESKRYAKATADKETREEIERGPVY